MESVYTGSTLTLAAASAKNSNEGFLRRRNPLRQQPCRLLYNSACTVLAEPSEGCYFPDNSPGNCTLDTRGWVFQERLLSPRTLYFGPDCVHWECCMGTFCEQEPFHKSAYGGHQNNVKTISLELESLQSVESPKDIAKFRNAWHQVIRAYSETELSFKKDKLPAIAGIAGLIQRHLPLQASFGVSLFQPFPLLSVP